MAQQTINVGTAPNDGTGTPLRTAFQYTNSNFSELYTATGPSGNNINVPGSATITGDLGVGTASPSTKLEVATATANTRLRINSTSVVATEYFRSGTGLWLVGSDSTNAFKIARGSNFGGSADYFSIGSATADCTWFDGAGGTRMTLNSTGLGIGAAPTQKLHVKGVVNFEQVSGGTNGWQVYTYTDGTYRMNYNGAGADELIIDTSGNVGIGGVTPSAWNANSKALQLGSIGTVENSNNADFNLGCNYNRTSAGLVFSFGTTKYATAYSQNTANGTHAWLTSTTAGNAGAAASFTQAMTLDASGNLLCGNTSNPNTARAYFRYDTLTTQPVINSASIVAASTSWTHFIGQSGNGSSITTSNIFIYGNGNIQNINGVYGTISDLRLKENIADARNYLSDLLKLRVVKYSLKEEASAVANKLGFIAQEVEQVFPAMVETDPNDGNKGIKTSVLIPMLVKAIQELAARVQTLETR